MSYLAGDVYRGDYYQGGYVSQEHVRQRVVSGKQKMDGTMGQE